MSWEMHEAQGRRQMDDLEFKKQSKSEEIAELVKNGEQTAKEYLNHNYKEYTGPLKIGDWYYHLIKPKNSVQEIVEKLKFINKYESSDGKVIKNHFKNQNKTDVYLNVDEILWHRKGGFWNSKSAIKIYGLPESGGKRRRKTNKKSHKKRKHTKKRRNR
jgi:hypothetical protein